jgi:V-type H+-transporting ATPase subunit a
MESQPLLGSTGVNISFVAGTIKAGEEPLRMQRMLFRITRGKALTHFSDSFQQEKQDKVCYLVVFQDGEHLRDRVTKICDSFMGSRFDVPSLGEQLFDQVNRLRFEITEARELFKLTRAELRDYMIKINGDCTKELPSRLEVMHNHIVKEKSIYNLINMLQAREGNYIGFCWAPIALEDAVYQSMRQFNGVIFEGWRRDRTAPHEIQPPTYFKMNDVIAPLQLITNTYGVPSYQEANPATFAIVTFPFLFAVMFGDYGHGSLLLFMGTCLVLFDDYIKKTELKFVRPFRYLFMMMGFFSCYNGLLYNEWFAIPYPWFNSCYVTDKLPTERDGFVFPYVDFPSPPTLTTEYDSTTCVYPFGMDPTWFLSTNDILVVQDSMKMKISVIIGVMHMSMGIFTKGLNQLYFGNKMIFWTEVVTGMIILNGLFGWMDVLIFIKWFYPMNPYSTDPKMMTRINQAPSIITIMINNFLAMGKQPFVLPSGKVKDVYLFNGQREISEILVVVVIIMIPIMLFVKPCSACCCPSFAGMPEYDKKKQQVGDVDNDASNPNYEQPII